VNFPTRRQQATGAAPRNPVTSTDTTNAQEMGKVLRPLDGQPGPAPHKGVQNCACSKETAARNDHRQNHKKSPAHVTCRAILETWAKAKGKNAIAPAKDIANAIGHLAPPQITTLMIAAIVADWRRHHKASTAYYYRMQLGQALRVLSTYGAPPIQPPKVPKPGNRAITATAEELQRILTAAPPHLRLFVLLYLQCGLRRAEAMRVTPRSWDPAKHSVTIKVKGGHQRCAEVTEDVETLFRAAGDPDPDTSYISALHGKPITPKGMTTALKTLELKCGINEKVTAHDLRRTAASILYAATKDLRIPQQLLAHKNLTSTLAYIAPLAPNEARRYSELLRFDHFHPKPEDKPS
jgi:integrase